MTGGGAFPVGDPSEVAPARRAAQRLAGELGFSETRAGQLALVVTELGTNLAKHAVRGELLLHRLVSMPGTAGVGRPPLREFQYPFPADATFVMHSDGIATNWDLAAYPGLQIVTPRSSRVFCSATSRDVGMMRPSL